MLSLEPEIERLRPQLGPIADTLIARERREVFSIHPELRVVAWGGAMLVAGAAGLVLKNNLERIGPLALAALIGIAAAACYAWVWRHRARASLVDEYILLLGALLVSADAAFIETQFHLFGEVWHRHFLVLAIVHGVAAYLYDSRTVLSLSIAALAAWLGLERGTLEAFELDPPEFAARAFGCAALLVAWRLANRRAAFERVFEHFAANLALAGALALTFEKDTRLVGTMLTIAMAAIVIAWGFRSRAESFVLYAFVYAVIAADIFLMDLFDEEAVILVSMIVAIALLLAIHARFRERR